MTRGSTRSKAWVSRTVVCLAWTLAACAAEPATPRVAYTASDQEAAALIAALGALSGERYQPDIEMLVAGITATRVSVSLIDAGPDACRQALAFALDCWWARDDDGTVVLLTGNRLPVGTLEVRTLTSTLRHQPHLQPLAERLLAPWLGGQAGLSYLPSEGLWSATLDRDGHRRLVELLSQCERPTAQAASRVRNPAMPDQRRITASDWSVHAWPQLVERLAEALQASVALSPRLRLRAFPVDGVRIPRQTMGQVTETLRAHGIAAYWRQGVFCLAESTTPRERIERQHPAQRRGLAMIPIGHLVGSPLDGELVAATVRRHVAPGWWELPGAGIEFLADGAALMVAADVDAQQAVLDAIAAIDTLGLELGLQAIVHGGR